jgi:hypothetical protein
MSIEVIIGLLVRHFLGVVGGSIIAAGWLTANELQMLAGALPALLAVAWSIYQKRAAK